MLSYIFWHRPYPETSPSAYESALLEFHRRLAGAPPPGFSASAVYRVAPTPWLDDREGYEDWYLVEASWALDPLNRGAVSGPVEAAHAAVAALMEAGHGGLYALVWGEPTRAGDSTVAWLSRPRGIRYEPILDELRERLNGAWHCWRRQMVLGPAPEFALVSSPSVVPTPPPGWAVRGVERVCLWPRGAA